MANWRTYIDPSIGDGQNTLDGIIANGPTSVSYTHLTLPTILLV